MYSANIILLSEFLTEWLPTVDPGGPTGKIMVCRRRTAILPHCSMCFTDAVCNTGAVDNKITLNP